MRSSKGYPLIYKNYRIPVIFNDVKGSGFVSAGGGVGAHFFYSIQILGKLPCFGEFFHSIVQENEMVIVESIIHSSFPLTPLSAAK